MTGQALAGRTAFVSGASQGIGLASAKALAADGARVVILSRRPTAIKAARDQLLHEVPGALIEPRAGDAIRENDVRDALGSAHDLTGRHDIVVSVVGDPTFRTMDKVCAGQVA